MINKLAGEVVRRGVLRALAAYVAIVWLLAQGLVDLFPAVGLPEWTIRVFLVTAVIAAPFVAVLAWKYDLTTKGFLRDRMDTPHRSQSIIGAPGPTIQSDLPDHGCGVIHAAWTNKDNDPVEKVFHSAFIIGRDFQADLRVQDDRVSRSHAKVYPQQGGWHLKDLGSLNGTYIGGSKIVDQKIPTSVELSLDKAGPSVRLTVRASDDTAIGLRCPEG